MNRPYVSQFLSNGQVRFEELWEKLALAKDLDYVDFQLSSIDFRSGQNSLDSVTFNILLNLEEVGSSDSCQMILDDFFLIYYSNQKLFDIFKCEDYFNDNKGSIISEVVKSFNRKVNEDSSQYCMRLRMGIRELSNVLTMDLWKKKSFRIEHLLEDLKLKLDSAVKKVGIEESILEPKVKSTWSRDKMAAFIYLLIETKAIQIANKKEFSRLISKSFSSKMKEDLSPEAFKKRLSIDYLDHDQYRELKAAWEKFEEGPLKKMTKLVTLIGKESADKP
ncbi:MAG: hypothetical protein A2017_00015 [Lentisphaerae bacterium GWF2_44_16]|nr:MAG: hypothetical protein A2017_00015 [Lentisphaerae bacterium GWF2_44_16]